MACIGANALLGSSACLVLAGLVANHEPRSSVRQMSARLNVTVCRLNAVLTAHARCTSRGV